MTTGAKAKCTVARATFYCLFILLFTTVAFHATASVKVLSIYFSCFSTNVRTGGWVGKVRIEMAAFHFFSRDGIE